jgi:predicted DNA-binding protein (MmcQ/YjbR family)
MKFNDFKTYCLSFIFAEEESPFKDDEELIAYRVMGKVFAITDPDKFEYVNLKCDPVKAATLRNLYEEVQPSNFKSERRWNIVYLDGILDDEIIKEWIKDSYDLVVEDLPRKKQRKIEAREEEE